MYIMCDKVNVFAINHFVRQPAQGNLSQSVAIFIPKKVSIFFSHFSLMLCTNKLYIHTVSSLNLYVYMNFPRNFRGQNDIGVDYLCVA